MLDTLTVSLVVGVSCGFRYIGFPIDLSMNYFIFSLNFFHKSLLFRVWKFYIFQDLPEYLLLFLISSLISLLSDKMFSMILTFWIC